MTSAPGCMYSVTQSEKEKGKESEALERCMNKLNEHTDSLNEIIGALNLLTSSLSHSLSHIESPPPGQHRLSGSNGQHLCRFGSKMIHEHYDTGQEGIASVIPQFLHDEFGALRRSLLDELEQQNNEPLHRLILQEVKLQRETFGKKLNDIENLLKLQFQRQMVGTPPESKNHSMQPLQGVAVKEAMLLQEPLPAWSPRSNQCLTPGQATPSTLDPLEGRNTVDVQLDVPRAPRPSINSHHSFYDEDLKELQSGEDNFASIFIADSDVMSRPYRVEDYYKTTGMAQSIARSDLFRIMCQSMVAINSVWIGIAAEKIGAQSLYDADLIFILVAQVFVTFFTFEWCVRFFSFRETRLAFRDGWFKFDTFLTATLILDIWGAEVLLHFLDSQSTALRVVGCVRVVRLLKLSRMARLMQFIPELVTMIRGVCKSFGAIFSTLVLISLMVYIWAIMLHGLLRDDDELNDKLYDQSYLDFRTMPRSMWTLLMDGSLLLDNSAPLMTQLVFSDEPNQVIAGVMFTTFALLSAYLILQMLIGVLCDVVSKMNEEQKQAEVSLVIRDKLLEKLDKMHDGSGTLSREELFHFMSDKDSALVLRQLKINRLFLMQLQETVFEQVGDKLTIRQVLEMMLMCRSDNTASVEVLAGGFCFLARELRTVQEHLQRNVRT